MTPESLLIRYASIYKSEAKETMADKAESEKIARRS
jgi:hypothetical protein